MTTRVKTDITQVPTEPLPLTIGDRVYWDTIDDRGKVTKVDLRTGDVTIQFDDGTFVVLDPESLSIVGKFEDLT